MLSPNPRRADLASLELIRFEVITIIELEKLAILPVESVSFPSSSICKRILKTSIVTARNAPAHERVITSLKEWGVEVDDAFFLGGIEKSRILNVMKPHIFFDDQKVHLEHIDKIPAVHIPFGIANKYE